MLKRLTCALSGCALMILTSAQAAEVVRVGTEATFAPFEFVEVGSTEPVGYDIDIIKAIAQAAGFEIEIVNMGFDGLIPALMSSQIDAAIAGMTITPERQKTVSFSEPYYNSGLSTIIRKEDRDKYVSTADLMSQRICTQVGTTSAKSAEAISGNVGAYNLVPEAFMELRAKGCEAVMNDRPVNLYFLSQMNSDEFVELDEILEGEQYGIAVYKSNTALLDKINSGLRLIHDNGTFAEIHKKWFKVAE